MTRPRVATSSTAILDSFMGGVVDDDLRNKLKGGWKGKQIN
jgi:hypothetical protein